jgi:SAM-dependent methyltransferase
VTPAQQWRAQLEAWALPEELLASVPESPYGWPAKLWQRRSLSADERPETTPTYSIVKRLAGEGGSILDIGAGTGRASLPLARVGHPLTAIEPSPAMAAAFHTEADGTGAGLIEGSWPDVAAEVGEHDVVMSAHVVYDVQDIDPFLEAAWSRARRGLVVEMTDRHPWAWLGPYYLALHGLERPQGPTADDFISVINERAGESPEVIRWSRSPDLWFEDWEEILDLYQKRLVLPEDRRAELRRLLASEVVERDGRLVVGTHDRQLVTLWLAR